MRKFLTVPWNDLPHVDNIVLERVVSSQAFNGCIWNPEGMEMEIEMEMEMVRRATRVATADGSWKL